MSIKFWLNQILVTCLLLSSTYAFAGKLYLHLASQHFLHTKIQIYTFTQHATTIKNSNRSLNQLNLGLGYQTKIKNKPIEFGAYYNSLYRLSLYAVQISTWHYKKVSYGLGYGLISGYMNPALPLILPFIQYRKFRLAIMPDPASPALGLSWQIF